MTKPADSSNWHTTVADRFNLQGRRADGTQVASCLASALTILGESLYQRVHRDVQRLVGRDSMLMPVSEMRAQQRAFKEIEAYQVAESAAAVSQFGYLGPDDSWYLGWLVELRLGEGGQAKEIVQRSQFYLARPSDRRRLAIMDALGQALPESRRAPLVLFRLLPLAVQIATACAFADHDNASQVRLQQTAILPGIADCHQCQGRVLECGEQCPTCGNPLWKSEWLTAID